MDTTEGDQCELLLTVCSIPFHRWETVGYGQEDTGIEFTRHDRWSGRTRRYETIPYHALYRSIHHSVPCVTPYLVSHGSCIIPYRVSYYGIVHDTVSWIIPYHLYYLICTTPHHNLYRNMHHTMAYYHTITHTLSWAIICHILYRTTHHTVTYLTMEYTTCPTQADIHDAEINVTTDSIFLTRGTNLHFRNGKAKESRWLWWNPPDCLQSLDRYDLLLFRQVPDECLHLEWAQTVIIHSDFSYPVLESIVSYRRFSVSSHGTEGSQ